MIHIEQTVGSLDKRLAKYVVEAIEMTLLQNSENSDLEVSVNLADDALLHQLNFMHLKEDRPTDVLSFPGGEQNPENNRTHLGDIAISIERAKKQAQKDGHSLEEEIALLAVHGTLHLLGHDHASEEEKREMWAAQSEVLSMLGNSIDIEKLDAR